MQVELIGARRRRGVRCGPLLCVISDGDCIATREVAVRANLRSSSGSELADPVMVEEKVETKLGIRSRSLMILTFYLFGTGRFYRNMFVSTDCRLGTGINSDNC